MSVDETQDLVGWVRQRMAERHMSQRRLGGLSGVDHTTISRLLRGGRPPTLKTAERLVRALGVAVDGPQVPGYLGMSSRTLGPVARVEQALRADPALGAADLERLLRQYHAARGDGRARPSVMAVAGPAVTVAGTADLSDHLGSMAAPLASVR